MNAPQILCTLCARFGDSEGVVLCEAFPQGIPREIYPGGFDHRQPFRGDGGLRFLPRASAVEKDVRAT